MTAQHTRPVGFAIWLIVASVVGWWAAFQLTLDKITQLQNPDAALSCNFSVLVQCGANLDSWQGSVFGFPNPVIGLTGWMAPLVVGVALLAGARFPRWFWGLFGLGISFAFAFICWLISQSLYEIRTLCPWCMLTWAVTIPTFLATILQLFRNGTFPMSEKGQERAGRLVVWIPLASVLAYALIIALAQFTGLDVLGELFGGVLG